MKCARGTQQKEIDKSPLGIKEIGHRQHNTKGILDMEILGMVFDTKKQTKWSWVVGFTAYEGMARISCCLYYIAQYEMI